MMTSRLADVPASLPLFSDFLLKGSTSAPSSPSIAPKGLFFSGCEVISFSILAATFLLHLHDDGSNRPIIKSEVDSSRLLTAGTDPCGDFFSYLKGWSTTPSDQSFASIVSKMSLKTFFSSLLAALLALTISLKLRGRGLNALSNSGLLERTISSRCSKAENLMARGSIG